MDVRSVLVGTGSSLQASSGRVTASLNTGSCLILLTGCQKQEAQFIFQVPRDGGARGGCNGDRTAEI